MKKLLRDRGRNDGAGELDMPMFGGKVKGSPVFIPIKRFLDWYCYVGQN